MPLDPFLESLLAALPPAPGEILDFPTYRAEGDAGAAALTAQFVEPGPAVRSKTTVAIPVEGGKITANIFHPMTEGPHPAHLYLHGGGFVAGSIHTPIIDVLSQERAAGADCVVVAVEYRKAPEHPFPDGLNDAYAALLWVAEHAEELQIRPDIITLGGGSAGANLAAALTLKVRDEGGPVIAFQLLEVPALDFTFSNPSQQTYGTGYDLTGDTLRMVRKYYLTAPDLATDPYVSPLLASDLSSLPPAHIMSSEFDPLRDDGEQYAQRLRDAGVPATFSLQLGHSHASSAFTAVMASARQWRDEALHQLRAAHTEAR